MGWWASNLQNVSSLSLLDLEATGGGGGILLFTRDLDPIGEPWGAIETWGGEDVKAVVKPRWLNPVVGL